MGATESHCGSFRGRGPGGRGDRAVGGTGRANEGQGRTGGVAHARDDANAALIRSQAAVQARYDLAVEAIKTFHTGVSEDFLLKQEQFKEVRDRLLNSASDFYGKLGALLGKESDLASRRALWQANYELAELTEKVGKPEDALTAHRQVLAAARRWRPNPGLTRRSRPSGAA